MRLYQQKTEKMILRLLLSAAVFVLSLFLLAACGGKVPEDPGSSGEGSGRPEENRPDASEADPENAPDGAADPAEDSPDGTGTPGGNGAPEDGPEEISEDDADVLPGPDGKPGGRAAEILYSKLRVIDSTYQYVNDYTWDDLYTLLAGVVQTTTGLDHRKPLMSIVRVDPSWDPLLFIGLRENGSETCQFEIYAMDGGYLYRLLSFDDVVYYDPETRFFYLKNAGKRYIYAPHVMLEAAAEANWQSHTRELPVWDLTGFKVSVDHLDPYILDLTRGGGSE